MKEHKYWMRKLYADRLGKLDKEILDASNRLESTVLTINRYFAENAKPYLIAHEGSILTELANTIVKLQNEKAEINGFLHWQDLIDQEQKEFEEKGGDKND